MNIFKQWKNYIDWIHFKRILEKRYNNLKNQSENFIKQNDILQNELKNYELKRNSLIAKLKFEGNIKESYNIYLESLEKKLSLFEKIKSKIGFFKFEGYIIYINKAKDTKILKIKDLNQFLDIKKEKYILDKFIGNLYNKPVFLIKYPIPISLNIDNKLLYDSHIFYNLHNKLLMARFTDTTGNNFNIIDFIKQNLILIIIVVVIAFIIFTPEGKQFLNGIFQKG